MDISSFRQKLRGPVGSIITPFKKNYRVDYEGISTNIEFLLDKGIKIIACCGSVGEVSSLTIRERKRVVETTIKSVNGEAMMIAGLISSSAKTVVELAEHAQVTGADAVMITAPYYFHSTNKGVVDFFKKIDQEIKLPVLVYNNPETTGIDLSVDLISELSKLKNFGALKDGTSNLYKFHDTCQRFSFPIIGANGPVILYQLLAGADGVMNSASIFAPQLMLEMVNAVQNGKVEKAFHLYSKLLAFRRLLSENFPPGYPAYIPYTKAALELQGLPAGPPRAPISGLEEDRKKELERILKKNLG